MLNRFKHYDGSIGHSLASVPSHNQQIQTLSLAQVFPSPITKITNVKTFGSLDADLILPDCVRVYKNEKPKYNLSPLLL